MMNIQVTVAQILSKYSMQNALTFSAGFYLCFIFFPFFLKAEDHIVTMFVKISQLVIVNDSPFFWLTSLATVHEP